MSAHDTNRQRKMALQRRKQKAARRQEREAHRAQFQALFQDSASRSLEENLQHLEAYALDEQRVRDGWIVIQQHTQRKG